MLPISSNDFLSFLSDRAPLFLIHRGECIAREARNRVKRLRKRKNIRLHERIGGETCSMAMTSIKPWQPLELIRGRTVTIEPQIKYSSLIRVLNLKNYAYTSEHRVGSSTQWLITIVLFNEHEINAPMSIKELAYLYRRHRDQVICRRATVADAPTRPDRLFFQN
jgi:hypothetical protein